MVPEGIPAIVPQDLGFEGVLRHAPDYFLGQVGGVVFGVPLQYALPTRNRYDSARYKATLKKNGVKVVSATEVISDGAEGIILESVLEGYAEYYSADLWPRVFFTPCPFR